VISETRIVTSRFGRVNARQRPLGGGLKGPLEGPRAGPPGYENPYGTGF
jgi:hypothetical protein